MEQSKIREMIRSIIKEMSSTGGTASVTPGTGEGVATKFAFAKPTSGYKPVDRKKAKKSKVMDYKDLWT